MSDKNDMAQLRSIRDRLDAVDCSGPVVDAMGVDVSEDIEDARHELSRFLDRGGGDNVFTVKVFWSEEDGEYVAICLERPSLSFLAPSGREAKIGMVRLLADELECDARLLRMIEAELKGEINGRT